MNFTRPYPDSAISERPERPIVFVIDGDSAMRDALESVICGAGWQAMTASSVEEFLSQPGTTAPCCLLVEHRFPDSDGFDLQDFLCDRTHMPIIFMSRDADVAGVVQAMKAGALDVLTKPLDHELLLRAIGDAIERSRVTLSAWADLDVSGIAGRAHRQGDALDARSPLLASPRSCR
jgi:FixJ family two-component response regulator